MYLTYEEYQEFGGTLDETTYNQYELEARGIVDWYTFDRLKQETELPTEVKECMYLIICRVTDEHNLLNSSMPTGAGGMVANPTVASQSNDGVSTTYVTFPISAAFEHCKAAIADIINTSLRTAMNSLGRKLLYRGLYPGE